MRSPPWKKKERKRNPAPPFTTSTLQQEASRKLGFSARKTMSVAQKLYEGIQVEDGTHGLITYMRTDSVALSELATSEAREVICQLYDASYALKKPRVFPQQKQKRPGSSRSDSPDFHCPDPGSGQSLFKFRSTTFVRVDLEADRRFANGPGHL